MKIEVNFPLDWGKLAFCVFFVGRTFVLINVFCASESFFFFFAICFCSINVNLR